jgi:hypothetical protein
MSIHPESDPRLQRPSSSIPEKFCAIGPRQKKLRRGRPAAFALRAGEEAGAVGERQFMCSMEERRRENNAKRLPAFKIIQENLCTLDI